MRAFLPLNAFNVIVVLPRLFAFTFPFEFTVATDFLEDENLIFLL